MGRVVRGIAVAAGIVGLLALLTMLVWQAPEILARSRISSVGTVDQLKALSDIRTSLVALVVGLGTIVGAVFAARAYVLNRATSHADRYSKAVEQLASEKLEIRLGGIYSLESFTNVISGDLGFVANLLATFVREASRREFGSEPEADVRAAVDVLSRGKMIGIKVDLRGAKLQGTTLDGGSFGGSILDGVDLGMANIRDVSFKSARLVEADFRGATLSGVCFRNSSLSGADFSGAEIKNCDFKGADLTGARGVPLSNNQ